MNMIKSGWFSNIVSIVFGVVAIPFAVGGATFPSAIAGQSGPPRFVIGERGLNHRVWHKVVAQTNVDGQVMLVTNKAYVELCSGLYFTNAQGQLQESKEEITILPAGGAAAVQGQHKVWFPADLYEGVIQVITPDGRHLKSRPLGISYYDGTNNVLIGRLTNSVGLLLPSGNQVIYTNAFEGCSADLLVTYRRSGLEADLVFRAAPPPPEDYPGLNADTARLQLWTEFFDTSDPEPEAVTTNQQANLTDRTLKFGDMKMVRGKAFALGTNELDEAATNAREDTPVYKTWQRVGGRTFLIEELPFERLRAQFDQLVRFTNHTASAGSILDKVSPTMLLPPVRLVRAGTNATIQLAAADVSSGPGVVWDYVLVNNVTGLTLQSDTTYYVSSLVSVANLTIEGGTVVKYASGATMSATSSVKCQTEDYRPAILTSKDDNSVGEIISGSSGNPSISASKSCVYLHSPLAGLTLKHLRFSYAYQAVVIGGATLMDVQFVHNGTAIRASGGIFVTGQNILMSDVSTVAFDLNSYADAGFTQLTISNAYKLLRADIGCTLAMTNSLLVGVQYAGSTSYSTNHSYMIGTGSIFQSSGAGNCYLTNGSPYRNLGTTNIAPELLAELQTKTTWAPTLYSNIAYTANLTFSPQVARDTNAATAGPDIGYHYPPIDYLVDLCSVSNATLTVTSGTVVASYLDSAGISLREGSAINAVGSPNQPVRFTYYNTVQEQPKFLSSQSRGSFTYACLLNPYHAAATLPNAATGSFRFVKFTGMAGAGVPFYHESPNWDFASLSVQDSEFGPVYGLLTLAPATNTTAAFRNNLFQRTAIKAVPQGGAVCTFSNNLFWGSNTVTLAPTNTGVVYVYDNAFDSSVLNQGIPPITGILNNNFNAYITCTGTVPMTNSGLNNLILTGTLSYQAGYLGNYYQPTNSVLINAGSVTNAALAGLYHYTTTTNQVRETNSVVDIGYHYVSVDPGSGSLIDSDWDGIPDYLDPDADGDGLADSWEIQYFGNLDQNATGDADSDELTNLQEFQLGTNPTNWDTDGDGLSDSEELAIPVDVNHLEWGNLDPLKPRTGRSNVTDDRLDSDHDGLSNLAELRTYGSDPTNANTYSAGLNDAEYFFTARVELSGAPPPPPSQQAMARGVWLNLGDGLLQFTISGAFAGARYDLYFVNNLVAPKWQWRRVYTEIVCDANGEATITLQQPDPNQGYFEVLDAADDDGDGLPNGYETWFTYDGKKTSPNDRDTDLDNMSDDWEVEYGLIPTDAVGANGSVGDPDGDSFSNKEEYDYYNYGYPSYDPLKVYNTPANRPVVTILAANTYPSCPEAQFIISRFVGDGGNYDQPMTVYYSAGGLKYGTDYTLNPAPPEVPRIYSATIPAGQQSVTVTAMLIGNAVPSGTKTLAAAITPYSVSPEPPVSDPLTWAYVVDWNNNRAAVTFDFENLRPQADDQYVQACPNSDTPISLTGSDGCNDPLTFSVLNGPSHGTLSGTAPNLIYHPDLNYQGDDNFTFKVNDGLRDSVPATVWITVGDQPVANDQFVQTCRDTDIPITLTGSGACGTLTFSVVNGPTHGTLSGSAPNLTYHPMSDYEGSDSFTFKVNNGFQDSAEATVSIEVGYQPIADDQWFVTDVSRAVNITLTGSDGCNDPLTYVVVSGPTLGTLAGAPPNVVYTPGSAGEDSFNFKANDGVRDSSEATVSIVVLPAPSLTASCSPNTILLNWTIPDWAQEWVESFVVYRATTPGGAYPDGVQLVSLSSDLREYFDTDVTPGVTYYYVVVLRYTDPATGISHEIASHEVAQSTCCPPPDVFWTDAGASPEQLAEWLSEPGDTVANVAFAGAKIARGIFGGGTSAGLPIERGVILSSGNIAMALGPNNETGAGFPTGTEGDADLDALVPGVSTKDAAALEFDVTSQTGTLEFEFIFGAEEYFEFVGSFNDLFAIFVDGQNIAWVPGTTDEVIAVNTINDVVHSEYFTHNENPPTIDVQYDGLTTSTTNPVLTATVTVTTGVPHHVKLVIADAIDEALDSGVFIRAKRTMPCE